MSKAREWPRVGKYPFPGQYKICKCPTPGTYKAGKCPAVARKGKGGGGGGGGAVAQLELTDTLPNNVLVCFLIFKHLTGFIYSTASFLKSGVCKYCIA